MPPPEPPSEAVAHPPGPTAAAPVRAASAEVGGPRYVTAALLALVPLLVYFVAMNVLHPGPAADERDHLAVIHQFASGDWHHPEALAMFPAYHAILAFPARILGGGTAWIRATGLLDAIVILVVVGWAAARTRRPGRGHVLLQVLWLPVLFPFVPLIYTDPAAATWVFLAFALQLTRRPVPAAVALAVACLLRQSNVIWVAFFALWALHDAALQPGGFRFGPRPPRPPFRGLGALARETLSRAWPYLAVVAAVAAVMLTLGEAVPKSQNVVGPSFNPAQIFAFGLGAGVIWLPVWVDEWRGGLGELRAWPRGRLVLAAAGVLVLVVLLASFYRNPDPRNQHFYYLRNRALVLLQYHEAARLAASAFMVLTALAALRLTRRHPAPWLLAALWLGSTAFLSIHSTVDPRYAIVPMGLLAFFVVPARGREPMQAIWILAWSLIAAAGTAAGLWIP
jgi:hypothetical protein